MAESPVTRANREISFATACRWAGIDVPGDVPSHGIKVYCPFGEFAHSDGGVEPAFRVYTDHGYCFAEGEHFTAVKMCALAWDISPEEAAREMLSRAGIADPDYREQWKRLVDYSQPPDLDGLVSALRGFCARSDPGWKMRQYDSDVSGMLVKCIGLLGLVRTEEDCRAWLDGCKKAMARVLGKEQGYDGGG